ncbi:MAG: hypothetical protein AMJ90_04290 [candidate division Zixibacteria bacterium SM23_73_2]|nr:MAG: hypothetical protein AMJ90_04290 [candidate division Zixibacteria bacterium SM23_73_2]
MSKYEPIDLNRVRTHPFDLKKRKVEIKDFSKPDGNALSFSAFLDSLPRVLKASDLKKLIDLILLARKNKKPVIFFGGAHLIKCGLSPLLVDLMEDGFLTFFSTHGASIVHDIEIAFFGKTSEVVEKNIEDGSFGMTAETSEIFNGAVAEAKKLNLGLGEAIGKKITEGNAKYKEYSLFFNAYRLNIPACVHIGIGTDVLNQNPGYEAETVGKASFLDFKILCEEVSKIDGGGVVMNFGSAVILPEVFLKALSVARNIKGKVDGFVTANFDMIQHYRPIQNVVKRPTQSSGHGFSFTGHHEIMLPLLYWALKVNSNRKTKV